MLAVFAAFAGASIATVSQMGFGLTVATLLEATLVRVLLLPALIVLLGERLWRVPAWLDCALATRGGLSSRGLRAASASSALASCHSALIGSGRLDVQIHVSRQPPFSLRASLRAFNGRLRDGGRAIWLHSYGPDPPRYFVLPSLLHHRRGEFPTALLARLPAGLGPWPHLARFSFTLVRRYPYRAHRASHLRASCPLPPRFTAGIFPFARATYALADGTALTTTIARGCRAAAPASRSQPHTSERPARKRGRARPSAEVPSDPAAVRPK